MGSQPATVTESQSRNRGHRLARHPGPPRSVEDVREPGPGGARFACSAPPASGVVPGPTERGGIRGCSTHLGSSQTVTDAQTATRAEGSRLRDRACPDDSRPRRLLGAPRSRGERSDLRRTRSALEGGGRSRLAREPSPQRAPASEDPGRSDDEGGTEDRNGGCRRLRFNPRHAPNAFASPTTGRHRFRSGSLSAGSGCLDIAPSRLAGQRSTQVRVSEGGLRPGPNRHGGSNPATGLRR